MKNSMNIARTNRRNPAIRTIVLRTIAIALSLLAALQSRSQGIENNWTKIVSGRHELSIRLANRERHEALEVKHTFPGYVKIQMQVSVMNDRDTAMEVPVNMQGVGSVFNNSFDFLTSDGFAKPMKINSFTVSYLEFGVPYMLTYNAQDELMHLSREGRLVDYLAYFQVSGSEARTINPLPPPAIRVLAHN